ncbi:hypothetical protein AN189_03480 [Loktanella sp. 3ANDIMAR09]|uniref:DUF427 domain-containing protein n=1 Tax=Loktanella sp. 3ANDIMAR09 TaxID=1225657 RepID=UPI0006F7359D|nr:DUF427 domain-containing protein [Loktanella sp. 3ANDIMAR09]KQI69479.1 hypothetical protein AN189_03480 [Loktanella sp. 3ANDIMAR09]
MADHITISPATASWVVRAGGAVLGESTNAMILHEAGHDPVVYFPREDIAMTFLDATDHSTTCPFKGTASYFSIVNRSATLENVVWSYETPKDDVAQIAGYLAFDTSVVTVEEV